MIKSLDMNRLNQLRSVLMLVFPVFLAGSAVQPELWKPGAKPEFTGALALNEELQKSTKIDLKGYFGPAGLAVDSNGRIYYMRTRDFVHFTPSALLFDASCIAIDQTIWRQNDTTYYVFFKADRDTTPSLTDHSTERGILYVWGNSPVGPFVPGPGMVNTYREKDEDGLIEGPTLMKIGNDILMYYGAGDWSGAFRTTDLRSWARITDQMNAPKRYMHGTVIRITEEEAEKLLALR